MKWTRDCPKFLILLALIAPRSFAGPAHHLGILYTFHSGAENSSLTGASGYAAYLRAEDRKGFIRPFAQFEYNYSSGTASIKQSEPAFKMYGGTFSFGILMFFFEESRILPFVGGGGTAGYYTMRMDSPPTGVEGYTQGPAFGWDGVAGADIRLGSKEGNVLRFSASLWNVTTSLAGSADISGYRFGIGIGIYK